MKFALIIFLFVSMVRSVDVASERFKMGSDFKTVAVNRKLAMVALSDSALIVKNHKIERKKSIKGRKKWSLKRLDMLK